MAHTLRLVFEMPGGEARQFMLSGQDAIMGRAEHGDIVIEDDSVSGRHGIFRPNALGFTYADLGSKNGSAIQKRGTVPVVPLTAGEEVQLEPGDLLLLGSAETPARVRVEPGHAPFAPGRTIDRTLVATQPLVNLLQQRAGGVGALAAKAIAAESPRALADAALEFLTTVVEGTHAVHIVGGGFSVSSGAEAPQDLKTAARQHRAVVELGGDGTTALVAPLIARGTWHGFLAAWSPKKTEQRAVLDALNVAASVVALAASALTMRTAQAEALLTLESETPDAKAPLGSSPQFLDALAMARRLAPSDLSVLLSGETGSGKEVFARLLHDDSPRARGPFVAINCGAIPPSLLESELFGHVEGAFTGANKAHAGVFEQASGGTLFLDELGDMPLAMQAGILRALENGEIRRVGDTKTKEVDVRFVSATHKDLAQMAAAGTFRADLMYRIQAVKIRIPPLRERGEDVLELAHAFLGREAKRAKKRVLGFSPEALLSLTEHSFPGNVRELKNEVARAVALTAEGSHVLPSALSERLAPRAGAKPSEALRVRTLKECVELAERHAVELAMARNDGSVTRAAKELGLTRPGLYKVLVRLGMRSAAGADA